jgi:two-component system KDP operon response regulator KdpE
MKVLCIDNAPDTVEALDFSLKMKWPDVEVLRAEDGLAGLQLFERENPDLLILDIWLPGMNGYEVIRRIRMSSDVPIIILSVHSKEQDIANGLEVGADDYVTKPFGCAEFLARIQAIMRRSLGVSSNVERMIEVGELRINPDTRKVHVGDRSVSLTPIECSILHHLASNIGRVLTHQSILSRIWGSDAIDDRHLLTVHINHLRSKLANAGENRGKIITERGIGYRMALS